MSHNHKVGGISANKNEFEHHACNINLEDTIMVHAAGLLVRLEFRLPRD
jgi:hypothetical protein